MQQQRNNGREERKESQQEAYRQWVRLVQQLESVDQDTR